MNRKGQALVEFVLILPVFIFILFAVFDFGNIFYSKYDLQNQSSDIIRLLQRGKVEDVGEIYSKFNIKFSDYKEDYKLVTISRKVDLVTPGLNLILDDPYIIEVERVIPDDEA